MRSRLIAMAVGLAALLSASPAAASDELCAVLGRTWC